MIQLIYDPYVLLRLRGEILPGLLPSSNLYLFRYHNNDNDGVFPLAVGLIPVRSNDVRILTIASRRLRLTINRCTKFGTSRDIPRLVRHSLELGTVIALMLLPTLRWDPLIQSLRRENNVIRQSVKDLRRNRLHFMNLVNFLTRIG